MAQLGRYRFRRLATEAEVEQAHRLNHDVFVDELGLRPDPGTGVLVDKFHDKNIYFGALTGGRLVGMVAIHGEPPYSAADRLADPGLLDRLPGRLLEVRLLSIRGEARNGAVFLGLLHAVHDHAVRSGGTHLLISGVEQRVPVYRKLGFRALGPGVPCGRDVVVPMILPLDRLPDRAVRDLARWEARAASVRDEDPEPGPGPISLLPGPVRLAPAVRRAACAEPASHRDPAFVDRFERVRGALRDLVGGLDVALMVGGGTLANDAIAAALAASPEPGRGLILANGEFGERLARQAARFGLAFEELRWDWGRPWDVDRIAGALDRDAGIGWAWGVALESSTGMFNDVEGLRSAAARRGVRVCLDCVSGLGAVPLDLRGVHLASAAAGKSLASVAGLAIVFAAPGIAASLEPGRLPASLDLAAALATRGPLTTVPSGPVAALDRALDPYRTPEGRLRRFRHHERLGRRVRRALRSLGLEPIAPERWASPVLTTFRPPPGWPAESFRDLCREFGFEVGGGSEYLRRRGWLQVATMGDLDWGRCRPLFDRIADRLDLEADPGPGASGSATSNRRGDAAPVGPA